MSIAVNIYYRGTDGNAGKFAKEMESSGTADAIRREEGNIKYDYFFPMADPETVLLITRFPIPSLGGSSPPLWLVNTTMAAIPEGIVPSEPDSTTV